MMLTGQNLEAFWAVSELSTVTAAASKLGLTQTGVTQRIKSLERDLDVSLFVRSRKGMQLTAEGRSLLRYCRESRQSETRLFEDLTGKGKEGDVNLCIAGPTSFVSGRLVKQCLHLYEKWPKLNLQFLVDDGVDRTQHLKDGRAEFAILFPHQVTPELDSKTLKPDQYTLVAPSNWKGRALKEILQNERLFGFHSEDQTSLNYLKTYDLLNLLKKPRLFVNENFALQTLIISGVGFGILSIEIAQPLIDSGVLIRLNQGKALKDPLKLAWYPRSNMPRYFEDIVNTIR